MFSQECVILSTGGGVDMLAPGALLGGGCAWYQVRSRVGYAQCQVTSG